MPNTDLMIRSIATLALSFALVGPLCGQTPSAATGKLDPGGAGKAAAACERSVRELLATKGTPVAQVHFIAAPTPQSGLSSDSLVVLQGSGNWRSSSGDVSTFAYTCNADSQTFEVAGVVLRDTTPASAQSTSPRQTLEPDLSNLSPVACESSVAAILRKRWPRVSEISFESATRRLKQTSPNMTELHGRGRALPIPGAPISYFGFECEISSRDGRILNTRVSK
jgi:hypothetical protein